MSFPLKILIMLFAAFANTPTFASEHSNETFFDQITGYTCGGSYSPQRISRNSFFEPPIPHTGLRYDSVHKLPKSDFTVLESKVVDPPEGINISFSSEGSSIILTYSPSRGGSTERPNVGFIQIQQNILVGSSKEDCSRSFFIFVQPTLSESQHEIEWVSGSSGPGIGALSLPYGSTTIADGKGGERFLLTDCSLNLVHSIDDLTLSHLIGEGLGRGNRLGQLNTPADIKLNPNDGNLYVVDDRNHRIQVFSQSGKFLDMFGAAGKAGGDARTDLGYFRNPLSISFMREQLVVSDSGHNRLQLLGKDDKWRAIGVNEGDGTAGVGEGEFTGPYYMVTSVKNELFVVDRSNHRIQVFDGEGNYLRQFGSIENATPSDERGILNYPHELDIDKKNRIFVTDTNNNRINIYSYDGQFINDLNVPGFEAPKVVSTSKVSEKTLYLAFVGNHRVSMKLKLSDDIFTNQNVDSADINSLETDRVESSTTPVKIALNEQDISIGKQVYTQRCAFCHSGNNDATPQISDKRSWTPRLSKGLPQLYNSVLSGQKLMPRRGGCEECTDEELYSALQYLVSQVKEDNEDSPILQRWLSVADRNTQGIDIVEKFGGGYLIAAAAGYSKSGIILDETMTPLSSLSASSEKNPKNALGGDVLILGPDEIAVSIYRGGRIDVFDAAGDLLRSIGSLGDQDGELLFPLGLTRLDNGNILVADHGNARIQEFAIDGTWVRTFGEGVLSHPYDLKFHGEKLYVSDVSADKILTFSMDGEFIESVSSFKSHDGTEFQLDAPQGIDFSVDGDLYIANSGEKEILVVKSNGNAKRISHPSFGWIRQIEVLADNSFVISVLTEGNADPGQNVGGIIQFHPM